MSEHKSFIRKDGWDLDISMEWKENSPTYSPCGICGGSGKVFRDGDDSDPFDWTDTIRCCTCNGSGKIKDRPKTRMPPLPKELCRRLRNVAREFGEEFTDNPDWKEPFDNFGAGI